MKNVILALMCILTIINTQANNPSHRVDKKKKSVLIFTKNGLSLNGKKGYVHENIPTSIKALEAICELENIENLNEIQVLKVCIGGIKNNSLNAKDRYISISHI